MYFSKFIIFILSLLLCTCTCMSLCRYIEVFRTTRSDIKPVADRWAKYSRPAPYPGGGGGGGGGRRYDSDPYHRQ